MKRNNFKRNFKRNSNSFNGRVPQFTTWQSIVTRSVNTTAAVYSTGSIFTAAQVASDLSSSARLVKIRHLVIEVAPLNVTSGVGGNQIVYIQIRAYDSRSGLYIPVTDAKAVSNVNPLRMEASVPFDAAEWINTTSTQPLYDIVFTNPASAGSTAFNIPVRITSTFILSKDVPSIA